MDDSIDYGKLMHRALRSLVSGLLGQVSREGLPGEHHFFITFDTQASGVSIPDWMRERYPEEMTIVLQHAFDDLEVTDRQFAVTLHFQGTPERLTVPLDAVRTFVDPSVEFGLRFDATDPDDMPDPEPDHAPEPPQETEERDGVISLDAFRKS